jgi:hypothetical protein
MKFIDHGFGARYRQWLLVGDTEAMSRAAGLNQLSGGYYAEGQSGPLIWSMAARCVWER